MTAPIQPGSFSSSGIPLPKVLQSPKGASSPQFEQMLLQGLNEVQQMQTEADQAVQKLLVGEDVNTAEVLTAVQKANLAFQLMMQIRNKMVDAFQEIKDLRI